MGLDGVEVILCVEDEFSISVSDEEAESVRTVGDLFQLVLRKTGTDSECMTGKAFYRTRKAIVDTLGMDRRSIHPATWLEPLLPRETRMAQWKEIGERSGLAFPKLEHPRKWKDRFMLLSMLIAAIPVLALWWSLYEIGWLPGIATWLFSIPALIAWVVLVSRVNQTMLNSTPRLAYELPFASAGDLSVAVLALNYDQLQPFAGADAPPAKEQVWKRIVDLLCDVLQVSPEEVLPGTRIYEDLGVS